MIINLPKDLAKETTHRYGPNSFKLHRWVRPQGGAGISLLGRLAGGAWSARLAAAAAAAAA